MDDYIIIGGGISGLYVAYTIKKKYPNAKITILEKERIGGRMGLKDFYGSNVPIGAGIGRKNDKLLLALLQELNIPIKKLELNSFSLFTTDKFNKLNFPLFTKTLFTDLRYTTYPFDLQKADQKTLVKKADQKTLVKKADRKTLVKKADRKTEQKTLVKKTEQKTLVKKAEQKTEQKINILTELKLLRDQFAKLEKANTKCKNPTFKQFAKKILKKKYKLFIQSSGFSDYENEDVKRTLYNYNMEDNVRDGIGYLIDWNLLLDKLVKMIRANIKIEEVKSFKIENNTFITVKTTNGIYNTHKLIIATTATTLHKLISGYEYVCGQPFLRMYAKFNDSQLLIDRMKEMNNTNCIITDSPLQKILPINIEKGIYMISYSDNKYAMALKPYIKNTNKNRKHFEKLFNECIFSTLSNTSKPSSTAKHLEIELPTIKEIWGKFWDIGTHYFAPTTKKVNQMPYDNIFIIGEMISEHQGWTEGALDSVDKIKKYL